MNAWRLGGHGLQARNRTPEVMDEVITDVVITDLCYNLEAGGASLAGTAGVAAEDVVWMCWWPPILAASRAASLPSRAAPQEAKSGRPSKEAELAAIPSRVATRQRRPPATRPYRIASVMHDCITDAILVATSDEDVYGRAGAPGVPED
jgi:hypothetical protein